MSLPLRALVIDDERLARRWLCELLREHPEIHVSGEAAGVKQAIELIAQERPDVIFLDVQMPPGSGFDVLPFLPAQTHIVFVTAYDSFAIKAFDANALDYLLKPVHPERLAETVRRLLTEPSGLTENPEKGDESAWLLEDFIPLRDGESLRMVPVHQIAAIRADAAYTHLFISGQEPMFVSQTISEWERQLPSPPFIRLNRSLLLNLSLVRTVQGITRDETHLSLQGVETPLILGRATSLRLRRLLR